MSRISRVNGLNKNRVRTMYVERSTLIRGTEAIGKISPIERVENTTIYSNSNYLLASDQFYDKLDKLQEEYKRFYHDEQNLEKALKNIHNEDTLLDNMKILIEKYNIAIDSLKSFDEHFYTSHTKSINSILREFGSNLNYIGIRIKDNGYLEINESIFISKVSISEEPLKFLFEPLKGLIIRLYKAFKNISIQENDFLERNYHHMESNSYSGMIINKKS